MKLPQSMSNRCRIRYPTFVGICNGFGVIAKIREGGIFLEFSKKSAKMLSRAGLLLGDTFAEPRGGGLTRQTQWTLLGKCILSQSKVIAKKLLVTSDDVMWPRMHIAHVFETPDDLNIPINLLFVFVSRLGSFWRKSGLVEVYPIDL